MEKDSYITFTDNRPSYQFSSQTPLGLILKTAKERNWPILAIHTPDFVLSVLDPETYKKAVSEATFTHLGV